MNNLKMSLCKVSVMYYLILQKYFTCHAIDHITELASEQAGKLSSLYIDETLNLLRQDNPKLINILKENYIIPPSSLPYNFSSSQPPTAGQFGQAKYIADTLCLYVSLNCNMFVKI